MCMKAKWRFVRGREEERRKLPWHGVLKTQESQEDRNQEALTRMGAEKVAEAEGRGQIRLESYS